MDKLTNELIAKVANKLNLEPALLKTVTVVECGNRDGFLPSGRPQILFEGHIMWKQLKEKLDKQAQTHHHQAALLHLPPQNMYRRFSLNS